MKRSTCKPLRQVLMIVNNMGTVRSRVRSVQNVQKNMGERSRDRTEDQPRDIEDPPRDIEDPPRDIEDPPRDIEDQPRDVEDQRRDIEGQPRDVEDQRRDIEGQPRDVEGQPPTRPLGQPRDAEDESRDTGDNATDDDRSVKHDYSTSLANFPTELLVKILSYLPARDRFMMRNVSQRFRDVSEMPLLWKECIWNYEPRHVSSISKVLIENGEHVRRIFFPAHLTVKLVHELASHCTQVTHLSLPRDTQVTLDDLEKLVRTMTHLHQLDVFAEGKFIQKDKVVSVTGYRSWHEHIKGLLKVTATSVKELNLRVIKFSQAVRESIMELASQGHTLPIINIFGDGIIFNLSSLWVELHSKYESSSFQISLYDYRQIPMNLYPLIPLKKFKFGLSVTPPFIQLSNYGIVGIRKDIFCLSEYNCYGKVRCSLTPVHKLHNSSQIIPISYSHIDSVSYVDFSYLNIDSNHLEQLAVVCPNLQRLNLQENVNCLKHLQGLRAIVNTCQNLEGINLTKISVSQVESHVLLWELLSSLKKLTHLAIDICLMKVSDGNKQKRIMDMLKTCQCLKALEITRGCINSCRDCTGITHFCFSYFPSLTYCRMYCFGYSALSYAITNCHKLKYLYANNIDALNKSLLPLRIRKSCNLEQLCIYSSSLNLTDELLQVLSANGQLERVVLYVKSITVNGLTILINNSPKLTLLHVSMIYIEPPCDDRMDVYIFLGRPIEELAIDRRDKYTEDRVKNIFPHRELFTVGNFSVRVMAGTTVFQEKLDIDLVDTDLNSLWPSLKLDEV